MPRTTRTTRRAAAALVAAAVPALVGLGAAPASAAAGPSVAKIEGAAASADGLTSTVDAYRALLGGQDNGSTPGSQASGRREINWDGVPDDVAAPNLLPPDFFNTRAPRGVVFSSSAHDRFQVSADTDNPTHTEVRFGDIDPSNVERFSTFSPQRLFSPVGTTSMRIRFFEPGSPRRATVKGFGAVFTDVDRKNSAEVELYDRHGKRIWSKHVLKGPKKNGSLSFLGVRTETPIFEVRVTAGSERLGRHVHDRGRKDVVVLDDFLYAEPQPLH